MFALEFSPYFFLCFVLADRQRGRRQLSSDVRKSVPKFNFQTIHDQIFKVRTVGRLIFENTTLTIGLNVIYLMMFNNDSTEHVIV